MCFDLGSVQEGAEAFILTMYFTVRIRYLNFFKISKFTGRKGQSKSRELTPHNLKSFKTLLYFLIVISLNYNYFLKNSFISISETPKERIL